MATTRGAARVKAKAAPAKTAKKKAAPASAPTDQELITQSQALTAIPVKEDGLEIAPGISMLPALRIQASLVPLKKRGEELMAMAQRAVIDSPESYARGVKYLSLSKEYFDQVETYRKSVKGPIDDYGKFIQSIFKPLLEMAKNPIGRNGGSDIVSAKMLTYQQEEERKAREKQEAERKAREEEARRLAEEERAKGNTEVAAAIEDAAAAAPAPRVETAISNVRVDGARAQVTKTWTGEVIKPMVVLQAILDGKVPISVIDWSQSGLNAHARDLKVEGEFNGIKIFEKSSLGVR
jgi:hypothetical protein